MQHEALAFTERESMAAEMVPRSDTGNPLVSILMPAYNAQDTIAAAIRSVLAQTRDEWELIVVDDGSTDQTLQIARELAATDPRIQVHTQQNAGVGQARNAAATHANAEMFALLDSDDEYLPQYLERMFDLVQRVPDRDLYSCNGYYLFSNGMRTRVRRGSAWTKEREFTAEEMLHAGLVFIPAMFRKSAFERAGGFRRRIVEDYDLWARILLTGGRHIYTPELLALYKVTAGSLSTSFDAIQRARFEVLEALGHEFPSIDPRQLADALRAQQLRIDFADLERRIVCGDGCGARRGFFAAWSTHRTLARKYVGGATMLIHPSLYRRVFLGRLYPPTDGAKR